MGIERMAALVCLVAAGCGPGDRRAATSIDPWYSRPPLEVEFTPLDRASFAPVADAHQAEAQAALADGPARPVSADEAARLTGGPLPDGQAYVLLRAVVLNELTGGYTVSVAGRAVHVHHSCLGRHPVPMARKALVAVLPAVPETVYVSCSMAE